MFLVSSRREEYSSASDDDATTPSDEVIARDEVIAFIDEVVSSEVFTVAVVAGRASGAEDCGPPGSRLPIRGHGEYRFLFLLIIM